MKKRYANGGPIAVGAYRPPMPTSSGVVDRSQTTGEVLDNMATSNTPIARMKKGGYVKSADGCCQRGKTRGKYL